MLSTPNSRTASTRSTWTRVFYRRNFSAARGAGQDPDPDRTAQKADQNYVEQLARNAQEFFRTHGQAERAALLAFILPGSTLDRDRVVPAFKPPFDIIHRIAQDTKKQAAPSETTCPVRLPRMNRRQTPGPQSRR